MQTPKKSRNRKLNLERLENRELFAVGDVLAQLDAPAGVTGTGWGSYVAVERSTTNLDSARVAVADATSGSVYLYDLTKAAPGTTPPYQLTNQRTLLKPDTATTETSFGKKDVQFNGGKLFVGGNKAIYEFDPATLTLNGQFNDNTADGLTFNKDFAVSGEYVVVAETNPTTTSPGKISVFSTTTRQELTEKTTWLSQNTTLTALTSVAIDGTKLAFTAYEGYTASNRNVSDLGANSTQPRKLFDNIRYAVTREYKSGLQGPSGSLMSSAISGGVLVTGVPEAYVNPDTTQGFAVLESFENGTPSTLDAARKSVSGDNGFSSVSRLGTEVAANGRIAAISEHGRVSPGSSSYQPKIRIWDTQSRVEIAAPTTSETFANSSVTGARLGQSLDLDGRFLAAGAVRRVTILDSGSDNIPKLDLKVGSRNYNEKSSAATGVKIAPWAELSDLDNTALNGGKGQFSGGKLTVSISAASKDAADLLEIDSVGAGVSGIFVQQNASQQTEVIYRNSTGSATRVGILTAASDKLVIDLAPNVGGNVETIGVQELLRSIKFRSSNTTNIPTRTRVFEYVLNDGGNINNPATIPLTSNSFTKSLTITAVNDAPSIGTGSYGTLAYSIAGGQQRIFPNIGLVDPDSKFRAGSSIKLSLDNADSADILGIQSWTRTTNGNPMTVSTQVFNGQNQILINGTVYATYSLSTTGTTSTIEIRFNNESWRYVAETILQSVNYRRATAKTGLRAFSLQVFDDSGLGSGIVTKSLTIRA